MSLTHRWLAPAKLNLFLHITGQRADGYHCLQTVFQFLDYSDVLYFNSTMEGQLSVEMTCGDLAPGHNLVLKAAELLKRQTGTALGSHITVEKVIPIGGGLGGGSSDAATTLLALNQLWQLNLSTADLMQLGLQLGADVPVFIYGRAAWAEGIGEVLTPVTQLLRQWYLVLHPGCQVSTAEIFSAPELTRNALPITIDDFLAGRCQNMCEPVVRHRYPAVDQALTWLNCYNAAKLTGTGACVFAAFETQTDAQAVLKQIPEHWKGFVAQGKNISPAIEFHSHIGV